MRGELQRAGPGIEMRQDEIGRHAVDQPFAHAIESRPERRRRREWRSSGPARCRTRMRRRRGRVRTDRRSARTARASPATRTNIRPKAAGTDTCRAARAGAPRRVPSHRRPAMNCARDRAGPPRASSSRRSGKTRADAGKQRQRHGGGERDHRQRQVGPAHCARRTSGTIEASASTQTSAPSGCCRKLAWKIRGRRDNGPAIRVRLAGIIGSARKKRPDPSRGL